MRTSLLLGLSLSTVLSLVFSVAFSVASAVTFVSPTRTLKVMAYPQVEQIYIERCNDFAESDCFSAYVDEETLKLQYDNALKDLEGIIDSPTRSEALRLKMKAEIKAAGRAQMELPFGATALATTDAMVDTIISELLPSIVQKMRQGRPTVGDVFDTAMAEYVRIQDERREVEEPQFDEVFEKVRRMFLLI